jgi:hypothetical protein
MGEWVGAWEGLTLLQGFICVFGNTASRDRLPSRPCPFAGAGLPGAGRRPALARLGAGRRRPGAGRRQPGAGRRPALARQGAAVGGAAAPALALLGAGRRPALALLGAGRRPGAGLRPALALLRGQRPVLLWGRPPPA